MTHGHIAYIRVSSSDQNTGRQLGPECGQQFTKIFQDKTSGKDTNRPALKECLEYLREGDTLWVHSIDRLARSLQDLQNLIDTLLAKGVTVKFFKEGLTFQNHGTQDPFAKLLFQVLGSFAEFERNIIRERQREGIERAKEAGKYKHGKGGRKQTIDRERVKELRKQGVPFRKIAEQMGCSLSSVQRCLASRLLPTA
ncbi:Site-specific DNA recombinase [Desulfomicrobium norvegicum]|uniref:Site-specific DNA recombinase n=1 Tax=Desulfomicrobium norvegicum (strain DSM 1741 / NCIMB 8310) TaxID=52561 RepID=A0A8G2F5H0_DESNO|nr:recombinase family protein [Desulfomicrobium norvegicum]SFM01721.1 Site-specific DNA recombinase [Desulfomicrobium norvegicum]